MNHPRRFSTRSDHLKRRETVYQVIFIMSIAVCLLQIFTNSINNALLWAVLAMLFVVALISISLVKYLGDRNVTKAVED